MSSSIYLIVPSLKKRFYVCSGGFYFNDFEGDEEEFIENFDKFTEAIENSECEALGKKVSQLSVSDLSELVNIYKLANRINLSKDLYGVMFVIRMKNYFPDAFILSSYNDSKENKTYWDYEEIDQKNSN